MQHNDGILKSAKLKNCYIALIYSVHCSTLWSSSVIICSIFQIRGLSFHTMTKNYGLSTFQMRVRSLQTSYICELVKFTTIFGAQDPVWEN